MIFLIITVTLNPVVDHTAVLPRFTPGTLNRLDGFRRDASGKGINVSLALRRLETPSIAFCLLGGDRGRFVHDTLAARGIDTRAVWLSEPTRIAVKIFEETTAVLTELNERGPRVTAQEIGTLVEEVHRTIKAGDTLVLSGSIPPGVMPAIYADLIRLAREAGAWAVLDADGEAMRLGVAAGPHLIKPNDFEAGQLLGKEIAGEEEAVAAARTLAASGVVVLLTLGARGAIVAAEGRLTRFQAPPVAAKSSVGCGDAFLAAALAMQERGASWEVAGRYGVAAGAAAALLEGTNFPDAGQVDVLVKEVSPAALKPRF